MVVCLLFQFTWDQRGGSVSSPGRQGGRQRWRRTRATDLSQQGEARGNLNGRQASFESFESLASANRHGRLNQQGEGNSGSICSVSEWLPRPPTNHTRMRTRGKIRLACEIIIIAKWARGPSLSEISYTCIEIPRNLQKSLEISGNLWKSLRLCAKSRDPEESSQFDGKSPRNPEISQKSWKSRRNL